jgi:hypothetical protein
MYLNTVLEASMRTDNVDVIYDSIQDFVKIKKEPHYRLINKLTSIASLPDRLWALLKINFGDRGGM